MSTMRHGKPSGYDVTGPVAIGVVPMVMSSFPLDAIVIMIVSSFICLTATLL